MSLMQVPLALGTAWALWVAVTRPARQESEKESEGYHAQGMPIYERGLAGLLQWKPTILKTIYAACALAEALVNLAMRWPGSVISRAILFWLTSPSSTNNLHLNVTSLLAAIVAIIGGIIRYMCYAEMGRLFTFELTIREDHKLITSGPYSCVRHPGYTGFLMVVAGTATYIFIDGSYVRECGIWQSSLGKSVVLLETGLLTLVSILVLARVEKEDNALKSQFGGQWDKWRKDVPWKLIPLVY